jgi:hypothetical protein
MFHVETPIPVGDGLGVPRRGEAFLLPEMRRVGLDRRFDRTASMRDDMLNLLGNIGIWKGAIVLIFGLHENFACSCPVHNLSSRAKKCKSEQHRREYIKLLETVENKQQRERLEATPWDTPILFAYRGFSIDHLFPDPGADDNIFYNLGYGFDMIRLANALASIGGDARHLPMMAALLDVSKRTIVRVPKILNSSQLDPKLHTDQRSAIEGLHNLELVQGPPGTGKSFCIKEYARTCTGNGVIIISAVQNRAIDLIAEQLEELGDSQLPFAVLGSPETPNMGATAARFTLVEQAKRHKDMQSSVVNLSKLNARLDDINMQLEKLEESKRQRLSRPNEHVTDAEKRAYAESLRQITDQRTRVLTNRYKLERKMEKRLRRIMQDIARQVRTILGTSVQLLKIIEGQWPWKHIATALKAPKPPTSADQVATYNEQFPPLLRRRQPAAAMRGIGYRPDGAVAQRDEQEQPCSVPVDALVIDESGLCPEFIGPLLACLDPRQLVLFGDVNQLPPFSHLNEKAAPPSLVARLHQQAESQKVPVPMLSMQYRMHPDICELVSSLFYGGRLSTDKHVCIERKTFQKNSMHLLGSYWVGYKLNDLTAERRPPHPQTGYINPFEASQILEVAHALLSSGTLSSSADSGTSSSSTDSGTLSSSTDSGTSSSSADEPGRTVSIITYYRAQYNLFDQLIRYDPSHQDLLALYNSGQLRVQTVDSAQGTEADYVLLSCVRSNPHGGLGFLEGHNGTNRVCVSMSRARYAQLIFGNTRTLERKNVLAEVRHMSSEKTLEQVLSLALARRPRDAAAPTFRADRLHSAPVYQEMDESFL